jgi:hypothetical protein
MVTSRPRAWSWGGGRRSRGRGRPYARASGGRGRSTWPMSRRVGPDDREDGTGGGAFRLIPAYAPAEAADLLAGVSVLAAPVAAWVQ